jgi:hypothetical protein
MFGSTATDAKRWGHCTCVLFAPERIAGARHLCRHQGGDTLFRSDLGNRFEFRMIGPQALRNLREVRAMQQQTACSSWITVLAGYLRSFRWPE